MPVISAGILQFRRTQGFLEILLFHPGGPFWSKKNQGAWSIVKGVVEKNETPLNAAIRELKEEAGISADAKLTELSPVKLKSGKIVYAWAIEQDFNASELISNQFELEWPPRSGLSKSFPEMDQAAWFNVEDAKIYINNGQIPLIDQLMHKLSTD